MRQENNAAKGWGGSEPLQPKHPPTVNVTEIVKPAERSLGFRVYRAYLDPQKYVEQLPFGLYLGVLGYYVTYFWGPGRAYGSSERKFTREKQFGDRCLPRTISETRTAPTSLGFT